jgi:PAS domain S-box-containing protein
MNNNAELLLKIKNLEEENEKLKESFLEKESFGNRSLPLNIIDSIEALVYVSDFNTSEILFANKKLKDVFGDVVGQKCWEVFRINQTSFCESCYQKELLCNKEFKSDSIEDYNPVSQKWYRISDSIIEWEPNKKARLEILYDISTLKEAQNELNAKNDEFNKVISSIPNIVWKTKVDENGNFFDMYISVVADKILKIPEGTINNDWNIYFEYVHKDDLHIITDAINSSFITQKPIDIQYRLIDSEGKTVWVYSKGVVEKISKNVVETFGVTLDLTKLKEIEKNLEESESKYKTLFDLSPFPILVHQNNKIILWNKAIIKYLMPDDENFLFGKPIFDFIHPESMDLVMNRMHRMVDNKEELEPAIETFITPSGKIVDFEITSISIDYLGEPAILIILNDITEQRKNVNQLKELIATKDKFFSIIAHDLKNPFHQILGFAELLLSEIENYDKKQILKIAKYISTSAKNGYKLLENLLDWARSQTGALKYSPEKLNLFEIVRNEFSQLSSFALKKDITLINEISAHSKFIVFSDKEMLQTIFRNLISNAIKFTFQGGKVSVWVTEEKLKYKILISDSGIGIHPSQISKIFKIDETTSTAGTDNETGTGLGLILCKEFVEKNGGEISVESKVGVGSIFCFTLLKA